MAAGALADGSGVTVLATESTIAGGAYQRALLRQQSGMRVVGRPCPLWVTLAEQGGGTSGLADAILLDGVRGLVKSNEAPNIVDFVTRLYPLPGVSFATAAVTRCASAGY